jgi:membrane protease YdiL (CAAX protease family)
VSVPAERRSSPVSLPPERPEGAGPPGDGGPPDRLEPPPWPAWTGPVAFLAALAVAFLGGAVVTGIAAAAGAKVSTDDLPPWLTVVATLIQDAAFVLMPLLFARMVARPRAWQFGLRPTRLAPAVGWVAAAWIASVLVAALWSRIVETPPRDTLGGLLDPSRPVGVLIVLGLMVGVVAPVAEEVFFRGFFFRAVSNRLGLAWGALVSGLLFGVIHGLGTTAWVLIPVLCVLGVLLCLLYWRTGSLYPCIALHALNNGLAFGAALDLGTAIPLVAAGAVALSLGLALPFRAPPGAPRPL